MCPDSSFASATRWHSLPSVATGPQPAATAARCSGDHAPFHRIPRTNRVDIRPPDILEFMRSLFEQKGRVELSRLQVSKARSVLHGPVPCT